MYQLFLGVTAVIIFVSAFRYWLDSKSLIRKKNIQSYLFPVKVKTVLLNKHPQLHASDLDKVFLGLKSYFLLCLQAKNTMVAMPSQVVDDAWHEFILHTKLYTEFSKKSFGRYLHHTPVEAMKSKTSAGEGIKRAWNLACKLEDIDPKNPSKLPLLFDLDSSLKIKNGFYYTLDCTEDKAFKPTGDYCASHIGCSSGCSGGDMEYSDTDGSSCGGGCGGD